MNRYMALIPIAVLLSACSGGGDSTDSAVPTGTQQTVAPPVDSFISHVNAMIGSASDTEEPMAVDASPPSSPEDSEPSPVS